MDRHDAGLTGPGSDRAGELHIRPARPADYAAIADLTVRAYRQLRRDLGDYADELRDAAGHAASATVLVATDGERVVGSVTYVPGLGPLSEWEDPQAAGIRFLAVAPEHQGQGLGRALVEACIETARREGRPRLILHTTDLMVRAQSIYRTLGFERVPAIDEEARPGLWLRGYRLELA